MNVDEVLDLRKHLDRHGISEVTEVTLFRGQKSRHDGTSAEIQIEVHDGGPDAGESRWHVVATADDGRVATGNPAPDLETSLSTTRWSELDVG